MELQANARRIPNAGSPSLFHSQLSQSTQSSSTKTNKLSSREAQHGGGRAAAKINSQLVSTEPTEQGGRSMEECVISCSAMTFMSEQERKRRHKQRIAARRAMRKIARESGNVQQQRQMYKDLKFREAGVRDTLAKLYRAWKAGDALAARLESLQASIRENTDNAYTNLYLSLANLPNVKSKLYYITLELIRFVINLVPAAAKAVKEALQSLLEKFMGARPQVRIEQNVEPKRRFAFFQAAAGENLQPEEAAKKLSNVISDAFISKSPDLNSIKNLSMTFNALCVSSKFVYTFAQEFLSKYYTIIVKRISTFFGLKDTETDIFKTTNKNIASLCDYVTECDRIMNADIEMFAKTEFLDDIRKLLDMTMLLKKAVMEKTVKMEHHQKALVMRTVTEFSTWRRTHQHALKIVGNCNRAPFHISFVGKPKMGKSKLTNWIASTVANNNGLEWIFLNKEAYCKGSTKHWDRYTGQEIMVRDDFAQITAPNDLDLDDRKLLMDLMTPVPLQIPMADLADKGMISNVKLLITSSNRCYLQKGSVFADEAALNRRRDMCVYTVLDLNCPFKDSVETIGLEKELGNYRFRILDSERPPSDYESYKDRMLNGTLSSFGFVELIAMFTKKMNDHFQEALLDSSGATRDKLDKLYVSDNVPVRPEAPTLRASGLSSMRFSALLERDTPAGVSDHEAPSDNRVINGSVADDEDSDSDYPFDNNPFGNSSLSFRAACNDCDDLEFDEGCWPGHTWKNPIVYDWYVNYKEQMNNHSMVAAANVPMDFVAQCGPQTRDYARCFACGGEREAYEGSLYFRPHPDPVVAPWIEPESCDCYIHEAEFQPPAEFATGHSVRYRPSYDRYGSVLEVVPDVQNFQAASFSLPGCSSTDITTMVLRLYKNTLGWTTEMINAVCDLIPNWAWCLIIGLGLISGISAIMAYFRNDVAKEEAKLTTVELSEDDKLLFDAAINDGEELKPLLEYTVHQAKRHNWDVDTTVEQFYAASKAYDAESRTSPRRLPPSLPRTYVTNFVAASLGPIGFEQLQPKIMKNARFLTVVNDGKPTTVRCLFTHNRQFITVGHVFLIADENSIFKISYANGAGDIGTYTLKYDDLKIVRADNADVAFVEVLSESVPQARDIRAHFGSVEDIMSGALYTHAWWSPTFNCTLTTQVGHLMTSNLTTANGDVLTYPQSLVMGVAGALGDCGTVLIKNDKIVGILNGVANGNFYCSFTPVSRGDIPDIATPRVTDMRGSAAMAVIASEQIGNIFPRGTIEHVGLVNNNYTNKISDRSNIEPTVLNHPASDPSFELYEPVKFPPVMSLRDSRVCPEVKEIGDGPMQIGVDKFAHPMVPPKSAHLAKAVLVVSAVMSLMKPGVIGKRLLNMDEIINGFIKNKERVFNGLNMKTSMGVPFRNYVSQFGRSASGKNDYFDELPEEESGDPKKYRIKDDYLGGTLTKDYARLKSEITCGQAPFFVVAENLKDETLKESKIKIAKTRIFETLPCSATMVFREYFGGWLDLIRVNCVEFPISVGIAAQKRDWTIAAQRLLRLGQNNIIAGDYVNWDGRAPADVMFAACEVINKWYDDEYAKERECLVHSLVHQYFVAGRSCMLRHGGMSSGSPITSELNSLVNWLLLLCAIQDICEENGVECTSEDLKNEFEFMLYGDDHVVAVGPKFLHVVTFARVRDYMVKHGIGYTDSGKTDNVDFEYESLEQITFLKRKFVVTSGRYLAPLNMDSIRMSVMWWQKRKGTDNLKILQDKKNSFESELFMHGEKVYSEETTRFNEALHRLKDGLGVAPNDVPLIVRTYKEHLDDWFKGY